MCQLLVDLVNYNYEDTSVLTMVVMANADREGFLKPVDDIGQGWNLMEVVERLSCVKTLKGKPKLLFINAWIDDSKI